MAVNPRWPVAPSTGHRCSQQSHSAHFFGFDLHFREPHPHPKLLAVMTSPKKSAPAAASPPAKSALHAFSRRRSSDLNSVNAGLQQEIQELQALLEEMAAAEAAAEERARQAELREARLKELAKRFWRDEWSGMKDYVGLFNNGDTNRDILEIEERILMEYKELFGDDVEEEGTDGVSEKW